MSNLKLGDFTPSIKKASENTELLDEIVRNIVDDKCRQLDDYMMQIDKMLMEDNEIPTSVLETMLMNINSILYWVGNGLELITLQESVAKMIREESFNNAYNDSSGTMGDKKAKAALLCQNDDVLKTCYTTALKFYQYKVDRASEMASALKKILTRRTSEQELSRTVIR